MTVPLHITRIINSSVLMEIGDAVVLTDPYFDNRWYMGIDEEVGMTVEQLPRLSAIIGGHSVPDHWQMGPLAEYPYKIGTPVFVATRSMVRKARAAGFTLVEQLQWGEERELCHGVSLQVMAAQHAAGLKVNNYLLHADGLRVFFGSEACSLVPLEQYRAQGHPGVDVVVAPVNAVHLLGLVKLVMSGHEAVEATRILGARTLIAIHDAHRKIPLLVDVRSSGVEAQRAALASGGDVRVIRLPTGKRWTFSGDESN